MSAHSFPSLTSDSSSIPSRSSDLHESHNHQDIQGSVSARSGTSKSLSFRNSDANTEVLQLRNRVSKLEQDKFVLGDYAAELQSRIRHLERERMEHRDEIEGGRALASEKLSSVIRTSLSRPSTPTPQPRTVDQRSASYHRVSSSLSAATSTTVKRALSHASHRRTPSPTPSQLAFPSSTSKTKLVPKRGSRPVALDPLLSAVSESSPDLEVRRDLKYDTSTPTRRRLQAMYGRSSPDAAPPSPTPNGSGPSKFAMNNHDHRPVRDANLTRFPTLSTKPSPHDYIRHDPDHGPKRTTFTSKLDSIILTSKLFPTPSSRSKTPLAPVSPDNRIPINTHTSVIPLAHSAPSPLPYVGHVSLNSPPNKNAKIKLPPKGKKSLSHSLGLEENRQPDTQLRSEGHQPNFKSRGRLSFSEHLFSPFSDREDDPELDTERSGRLWGSWGRKRRQPPPPFSLSKDEKNIPISTPPSAFLSRSDQGHGAVSTGSQDKRNTKRHSLAAGCLRSIVSGSGQRDKSGSRERQALHRSHSESQKSPSRSPSRSRARPDHENVLYRTLSARSKDKPEKRPITPSRVSLPKPKGRMSEMQGGEELERTNSLRSAGRWGQRGKGFAKELTRRRTIHPMFSFERPGSTDAVSTSSSHRADDEQTSDEHRVVRAFDRTKVEKLSRSIQPQAPELPPHSPTISQSHATHAQDDSLCSGGRSGHTGGGVSRSESRTARKPPMVRTRMGVHHGTFAFEPAAAVVCPPRSAPPTGTFMRGGSLSRGSGKSTAHGKAGSEPAKGKAVAHVRDREYRDFCEDLKAILGEGEEWASFRKYIRRFDIEVLTAEVLLQRVKKLIDGSSTDRDTKMKLYDRFVKIVHDNLEEQIISES